MPKVNTNTNVLGAIRDDASSRDSPKEIGTKNLRDNASLPLHRFIAHVGAVAQHHVAGVLLELVSGMPVMMCEHAAPLQTGLSVDD